MKKTVLFIAAVSMISLASCKKNKCHECHYEDTTGAEVELGEKCGDELENLESTGYNDTQGNNYEVHCHEH